RGGREAPPPPRDVGGVLGEAGGGGRARQSQTALRGARLQVACQAGEDLIDLLGSEVSRNVNFDRDVPAPQPDIRTLTRGGFDRKPPALRLPSQVLAALVGHDREQIAVHHLRLPCELLVFVLPR